MNEDRKPAGQTEKNPLLGPIVYLPLAVIGLAAAAMIVFMFAA